LSSPKTLIQSLGIDSIDSFLGSIKAFAFLMSSVQKPTHSLLIGSIRETPSSFVEPVNTLDQKAELPYPKLIKLIICASVRSCG
jgi:hypothetical protein